MEPREPRQAKRRSARRKILWLLLCGVLAALFFHWENTALEVTHQEAVLDRLPGGFDGCRLVVLGDLHTTVFGEGNGKLLDTVREQAPDMILLAGDLVDSFRSVPAGYVETVAAGLAAIAPTYYVTGNHEWVNGWGPALKRLLAEWGVTVLDNRFVELERGGETAVLAGIDDPNGYADQKTPEELAAEIRDGCGDTFWMLLAHRNDRFAEQYSRLGADLVISGHGHGGLVRLPFTDGLISTDRTLFPSYTAGIYEENGSVLFVTRGLGNSGKTFRLFNRPEVAVLTLRRAGEKPN